MSNEQSSTELVPRKRAEILKPKAGIKPIDQDILDIEAARLRVEERLQYREIAQVMGCSTSTAYDRVQRVYQARKVEATDQMRQQEHARLDMLWQHQKRIAEGMYYQTAHGKVVKDPETGTPLVDPMPNIAARKEMRAIAESMRKLEGLDQPTKVEQTGAIEYKISGANPSDLV
jgi:hypothetical protein